MQWLPKQAHPAFSVCSVSESIDNLNLAGVQTDYPIPYELYEFL